ncbi:MAG: hypothetical protein EBS47_12765, partial [Betaproteobacteria bacterium]|nr:hypothetical protein [Betaproteobacteria bacterium]
WVGQAFEDEKLDLVQGSALARHSEIAVPGGGQFKLAMAAATFRYRPDVKCTVDKDGHISHRARVEHQVNLLPAAQGKGLGEVLEGDNQETARKAAADMGAALAAFHRTHLISEEPLTTGGLRTLVHGDFHSPRSTWPGQPSISSIGWKPRGASRRSSRHGTPPAMTCWST